MTSAVQPFSTDGGAQLIVSTAFLGTKTCSGLAETGEVLLGRFE